MKRILKRSFVFIITFVLVFSISVPCFASDTSSGATGWSSWTLKEKTDYCCKVGVDIIASVTGIVHGDTSSYKEYLLDLYASNPKAGVDNFYEYLATGLSFDDDTQTWELSDDLVEFCNSVVVDYNDRVTMVYRYPLNKANIDASNFPNKIFLDTFISVMQAFPDCYFYVESDYRGNYDAYDRVSDTNSTSVWPNHYIINVVKSPFAGVNAYPDLVTTPVTLYNENWEVCKAAKFALCSSDNYATTDNITYFSIDNIYYYNAYRRYDGTLYSSFDDFVNSDLSYVFSASDVSMCNKFSWNRTLSDLKTPYTFSNDPINVYKTVADMKKDIGSQFVGSYADTYTGTPSQTITQSEVNNIVNNYYPSGPDDDSGSGGGSDDSGGGSGGGVFDDIISGIASGVGSIIKGIFSIFKDLVDAIADAIVSIAKSITDLSSLLKTDFTDFLSAVFPFLPQEFITIMIAGLTLCLLGIIIKIFRG